MPLIPENWQPQAGTLVYIERLGDADAVLLIRKKRGHGANKINAPGGRVERDETPLAGAKREVREEVGLRCRSLWAAALLRFHDRKNGYDMRGFVFRTSTFDGEPVETAEAAPFWCRWDALPLDDMWEDDRYWLPAIRAGRRVRADLVFENDRLVSRRVRLVRARELDAFLAAFNVVGGGQTVGPCSAKA